MNENAVPAGLKRTSVKEVFSSTTHNILSRINKLKLPRFIKNKWALSAIAMLLIALAVYLFSSVKEAETGIPTFKVKRGNFFVSITESGELRAKNSISIVCPRVRGNAKIVYLIPEGTYVKEGDEVVRFDPTEASNMLRDAESRYELAVSDMEKLEANQESQNAQMEAEIKTAELTYQLSKLSLEQMRFEAEVKQQQAKLESQKNELSFERTKRDIESRKIIQKTEKNRLNVEIRQKKAELESTQKYLESLTLKAPKEGLVVYEVNWGNNGRKFTVGDNVWPGATVVTLPDLSSMESITSVNEVDVSKVRKGQKVLVKLDAFQDSSFEGKISDVASLGRSKDNNSSIKVFEISVSIKGMSSILKPGMTTSNKFIINEIPNVLSVPKEAVFEKHGKKIVYVKNGSSFDETQVMVGEKSEDYIIIKKGLADGAEVALRDPTIIPEENEGGEPGTSNSSVQLPDAGK